MAARPRDLETVVRAGLCTGCGLCASVAGDRVQMAFSPIGQLRPRVDRPLPPAVLEEALAVCPGVEVVGPAREAGVTMHPVWGPIASLDHGWAADPAVRLHAAAGGALSALALYLLDSGEADAILHVRAARPDRPMETDAHVSRTRADVLEGAQSRYGPATPLVHVHRLLEEGIRFAVVAKPCDISAIRALQRRDARARERIVQCLTLFCGGVPSLHMARRIAGAHGVAPEEVTTFRFRGEGWPGPLRTVARDGRVFDVDYDTAWFDPSVPWTYDMQFRCKICPDAIGEVADVACPDGWIMEGGRPVHREAPPGRNLVIARTGVGLGLVERARAAGYLHTEPCSVEELDRMHTDHHPRRMSAPARALGVRLAGRPTLGIRRYRSLTVSRRAGARRTLRALVGAYRRARRGAASEPLPGPADVGHDGVRPPAVSPR